MVIRKPRKKTKSEEFAQLDREKRELEDQFKDLQTVNKVLKSRQRRLKSMMPIKSQRKQLDQDFWEKREKVHDKLERTVDRHMEVKDKIKRLKKE